MDIERLLPRAVEASLGYIQDLQPEVVFHYALPAAVFLFCCFTLWRVQQYSGKLRNGKSMWKRGTMSSELHEREVIADAICNALEQAYFENKITLRARNRWYARIGKAHKLKDLVPKQRKPISKSHLVYLRDKAARGLENLKKLSPFPIPGKPGEPNGVYKAPVKKRGVFGKRKLVA